MTKKFILDSLSNLSTKEQIQQQTDLELPLSVSWYDEFTAITDDNYLISLPLLIPFYKIGVIDMSEEMIREVHERLYG